MTDSTSALTSDELVGIAEVMTAAGTRPAGPLSARVIAGGRSNLTYELADGQHRWVMRTPPRAGRTPSAHDVAREWRVTNALGATAVPVARAVALCEDEALLGGAFAIAEFVDGSSIQSQTDLDTLDDAQLASTVSSLIQSLADLHRVDHVAIGLERFGRPDAYAERQIRRWSGQWELVGTDESAFDAEARRLASDLIEGLNARVPEQRSVGIVHGDYRIDNTLLGVSASDVTVRAVIDWELSTIGDPVADVATMCAYRDPAFDLIHGRATAWTSHRLPSADELASAYTEAGGVPLDAWDFHRALAFFKLAVIAAGIDHRYRAGATEGDGFDTAGASVPAFLTRGLDALHA